jgi:hypothetical protein
MAGERGKPEGLDEIRPRSGCDDAEDGVGVDGGIVLDHPVHDFVDRAVPANGDEEPFALFERGSGEVCRVPGVLGGPDLVLQSAPVEMLSHLG